MECTCSVCENACDVFRGTAGPIVQFIRACDFANVYRMRSNYSRTKLSRMEDFTIFVDAQVPNIILYIYMLYMSYNSSVVDPRNCEDTLACH